MQGPDACGLAKARRSLDFHGFGSMAVRRCIRTACRKRSFRGEIRSAGPNCSLGFEDVHVEVKQDSRDFIEDWLPDSGQSLTSWLGSGRSSGAATEQRPM
jgi:hypothetical protein